MEFKDVEGFRSLIIELDLPQRANILFGVRCPVCGKTDRICLLEPPDELAGNLGQYARYIELWSLLKVDGEYLAVCKFCGYLHSIDGSEKLAKIILG